MIFKCKKCGTPVGFHSRPGGTSVAVCATCDSKADVELPHATPPASPRDIASKLDGVAGVNLAEPTMEDLPRIHAAYLAEHQRADVAEAERDEFKKRSEYLLELSDRWRTQAYSWGPNLEANKRTADLAIQARNAAEAERDELKQVLSGYKVHDQLIAERDQLKSDLAIAVEALRKTKDLYRAKDDSRLVYVDDALETIGTEK